MLSWIRHQWTSFYLLICGFASLVLFLYGFFPIKYHAGHFSDWDDLPTIVDNVIIDGQEIYNPGETSVVFMVIDGLRYDFVTEEYMPFTAELLKNGTGCIHIAVAEPPTVTMPRIKAMMTGSVSTFADVALNFGAPAVRGDSVLRAAHLRGHRLVLYGDDTWLRLFPGLWAEYDGTTSFYVTDYTEVDNNVTRHLDSALKPKDDKSPKFDLMVLHYLGLDHIGHLEGARSPKIKPKLIEMDEIVKKIHSNMKTWDRKGVILVCGDHGMRDAGGHGGSSPAELLVPLVTIHSEDGFKCPHDRLAAPVVSQTDVAPTLAWWLRVNIPGDSLGRVLSAALPQDTLTSLYVLHYNARMNVAALISTLGEEALEKECYKQLLRAEKLFGQYITTKQAGSAKLARQFYEESFEEMSRYLSKSSVEFDMFAITLGIILMLMIFFSLLIITIHTLQPKSKTYGSTHSRRPVSIPAKIVAFFIVTIIFGAALTFYCAISESNSCLCSLKPHWLLAMLVISAVMAVNYFIIKNGTEKIPDLNIFNELNSIDLLLIVGSFVHSLTFVGTSFIEEEHQTWYFLWNTLMFLILLRTLDVLVAYYVKKREGATEIQEKPLLASKMTSVGLDMMPKWILLIALHRFLRTLNQTGDRWAFLPDTADWLNEPDHHSYLMALMLTGKLMTLIICLYNVKQTKNLFKVQTLLTLASFGCVILYRMTTQTIPNESRFISSLDDVQIVTIFWGIIFIKIVYECISHLSDYKNSNIFLYTQENGTYKNKNVFLNTKKEKIEDYIYEEQNCCENDATDAVKLKLVRSLSYIILNNMMLVIILLMRPHNVILVPSVYVSCFLTSKCIELGRLDNRKSKERVALDVLSQTLVHFWVGCLFFYYQGNSNSLASVDLGAGYVGLREYSAWRVALRMGIHAYAAPALAGMILFCNITKAHNWDDYKRFAKICTSTFSLTRVYGLATYLGIAAGFRHHLFVWTVFSPKLLYDFVATIFSISALFTIVTIINIADVTRLLAFLIKV